MLQRSVPFLVSICFLGGVFSLAADQSAGGYSYRTGEVPGTYRDIDYYPEYYQDPGYYYHPKEEYGLRMGDWDYHNKWHQHKRVYYEGQTQSQYFRHRHPYGPGGIGYDPDEEYLHIHSQVNQNTSARQPVSANSQPSYNQYNGEIADDRPSKRRERARYDSSNYTYEHPDDNNRQR